MTRLEQVINAVLTTIYIMLGIMVVMGLILSSIVAIVTKPLRTVWKLLKDYKTYSM